MRAEPLSAADSASSPLVAALPAGEADIRMNDGKADGMCILMTAFQPSGRPTPGAGDLYGVRLGREGRPPSRVDLHVIATGDR